MSIFGHLYVKPADDRRVRQPERGNTPIPLEGAWVPDNTYYQRRLNAGDLILATAPELAPASPQPTAREAASTKE